MSIDKDKKPIVSEQDNAQHAKYHRCPNCGAATIRVHEDADLTDVGNLCGADFTIYVKMSCENCKSEWDDVYRLDGWTNGITPDGDEIVNPDDAVDDPCMVCRRLEDECRDCKDRT